MSKKKGAPKYAWKAGGGEFRGHDANAVGEELAASDDRLGGLEDEVFSERALVVARVQPRQHEARPTPRRRAPPH